MAGKVGGGRVNEAETCMGALQRSLVLGPEFVVLNWLGHATVGGGGGFSPDGRGF